MCGIVGFIYRDTNQSRDELLDSCLSMTEQIKRRGPDAVGVWVDEASQLALGHRRLSIIDLSSNGAQPMVSQSGNSVISYNGEVYNFKELKAELISSGVVFRGHSDTEVILEACEHWGVERTAKRLIGMFAFAFWNGSELFIVRDRIGVKPLYWGLFNKVFLFGSELKSLRVNPYFKASLDKNALATYIYRGHIPAPFCIYENVHKLLPGHILKISKDFKISTSSYWSLTDVYLNNKHYFDHMSDQEVINNFDELLKDAIRKRMISDVPLGAFLSGGIDSSLVVAIMQELSSSPIKTFSIGYKDKAYSESEFAKAIAEYIGTDHSTLIVEPNDVVALVPELPLVYDEPMCDMAQPAVMLLSKLTRKYVTVSLSGDGGDELFIGYHRYWQFKHFAGILALVPDAVKPIIYAIIHSVSPKTFDKLLPNIISKKFSGHRIHAFAELFKHKGISGLSYIGNEHLINICTEGCPYKLDTERFAEKNIKDFIYRMQFNDMHSSFPDDMLTKVDRASMWYSLEVRVPLVDHRIVEMAFCLPEKFKLRNRQSKWLMRQILYKRVPKKLTDRPKQGFTIPTERWLRVELKDWLIDLLSTERIKAQNLFDPRKVEYIVNSHLKGTRSYTSALWKLLMFQAWYNEYF